MQGGARRPENDAGSNLLTENGKRGTGVFFRGRNLLSGERRFLPRPPHFEESRIAVRLAAVPSGTPRFRFIDTYCETRERRKSGRIAAKADLPPGRAAIRFFHRLLFTAYLKIHSSCRPSFSAPLFEESRIAVRLAAVPSGTPRFRFIDTYCETRERRKSGRIAAKADLPPGRAANPLFHRLLFTAYLKIYSSCRPSFSAPSSKKAALLSVWRPCRPVRRVFVSPIRIVKRANGEKAGG